eukprot:238204-Lingulodinium_polyedra.AAC.1
MGDRRGAGSAGSAKRDEEEGTQPGDPDTEEKRRKMDLSPRSQKLVAAMGSNMQQVIAPMQAQLGTACAQLGAVQVQLASLASIVKDHGARLDKLDSDVRNLKEHPPSSTRALSSCGSADGRPWVGAA